MVPSGPAVFAGAIGLFAILVPLGICLLWVAERVAHRRWRLSTVERVLIAFYAAGALCYLIASVPLPLFGIPLLVGLLSAGAVGFGLLVVARETPRFLASLAEARAPAVWGTAVVTAALIGFEAVVVGTSAFPNTFDGSVQVLFLRLLLTDHSVPSLLVPYAQAGVIYPQGTAVWLALPTLLYAWPLTSAPVVLPPLFLGLSAAGAYCWGERWSGFGTVAGQRTGLLFAIVFAAVTSWPRFLVGGSYDFVFAVPLLFVFLGLLPGFVRGGPAAPWADVWAMAIVAGALFSMSAAVGEAAVVLLVGFLIAFHRGLRQRLGEWALRVGLVIGVGALFLVRSLVGIAIWFSYPGHVLSELGTPPYAPSPPGLSVSFGEILGELDPFVLTGTKLSPLPGLQYLLAGLLLAGVVILFFWATSVRARISPYLPRSLVTPIVAGTAVLFLLTSVLLVASASGSPIGALDTVASLEESSILLFIFFQAIILLPLVSALNFAVGSQSAGGHDVVGQTSDASDQHLRTPRRAGTPRPSRWNALTAVLVTGLLVVIGAGVVASAVNGPSFIHAVTGGLANVTEADVTALEWAGSNLPTCSRVLVAPGSAAQFLPAYARVAVLFPMNPAPLNLSYSIAVDNLTAGNFTAGTRSALVVLGVTEVFITGKSSFLFEPFRPAAFSNVTDFRNLFSDGDAAIYAFEPVVMTGSCAA